MSLPTTRQAYTDCYEVFDRALDDSAGVRLRMTDYDQAVNYRMRMHQARKINRDDNAKTLERDHPMHGASVYDKLIIRIKHSPEQVWLYIEHIGRDIDFASMEPLSQVEEPTLPAPEPVRLIESPQVVAERINRRV